MDLADLAAESRVWFLLGKGGVGKTAVSCAMGRAMAEAGRRVLIIDLEGRPEIPRAFGFDGEIGYEPELVLSAGDGSVEVRRLTADEALLEYLDDHGLARLSRRLLSSGVIDMVASAIPGIREVLLLGKVKQIANEADVDVVLVDAPATGHAVTLLTSPAGVAKAARSGPVRSQADAVVEMLSDASRSQVILVTMPEELPVTETVEAAFRVEEEAGVALAMVVANRTDLPVEGIDGSASEAAAEAGIAIGDDALRALDQAAAFQRQLVEDASEQLDRLAAELPLPVVVLPRIAGGTIGPEQLAILADALRHAPGPGGRS